MSSLLDQIDDALTSRDTSDAVRLWLWLRISAGGDCTVVELLESELPNLIVATNSLCASQRIKFVGARVICLPYTKPRTRSVVEDPLSGLEGPALYLAALENPRCVGAAAAARDAERWVFDAYNRCREKYKARSLPEAQRIRHAEHWRACANFVLVNKIDINKFIQFAYDRTRWQKSKFPAPSLFSGEWLKQEWADRDAGKAREHAGHSYSGSDGLQAALVEAGFEGAKSLDDKLVRHVFKMAKAQKHKPKLRTPHSDKEIEAMVMWTATNYGEV